MTVKKEKTDDTLRVEIEGSVDAVTSPELERELLPELSDVNSIIFNMKDMDYISSAGLRVLLKVYQIIRGQLRSAQEVPVRSQQSQHRSCS